MRIQYKKIPEDLLRSLPDGMKFLMVKGQQFLVVLEVACPEGHSLMDEDVRIHGEPSIRIKVDAGKSSGHLFVDPFWGGHSKLYDFVPVMGARQKVLSVSCPVCGTSLMEKSACRTDACGAGDAFVLHLPGGKNKIHVCARLGCPGHHLEVLDMPLKLSDELDQIHYFQTYEDEIFGGI